MDLDDAKTGRGGDRTPGMQDLVEVYKFPPKKWVSIRLIPGMVTTAMYWIKTKKKDGGATKFPSVCPSWDAEAQDRDSTKYDPWRDLQAAEREKMDNADVPRDKRRDKETVQFSSNFWMQAIVRSVQKKAPGNPPKPTRKEAKTGFKDKESDTFTAKQAIRMGKSFVEKVQKLKGLNVVEGKSSSKAFSVSDVKYGRDIRVYHDPDAAPADQYQVQLGEKRTPLTEEELEMLGWDLVGAASKAMHVASDDEIRRDFEGWAKRNGVKLKASSKKSKSEDEDDSDDDGDDFDDEDEDEKPKGKKGKPAAKKAPSKKSKSDDDEDEEEDFDDEEDEEDEKPKKGKAKPAPKKGKKSNSEDEDEEEEEDDFDDEEDEDEDEEEEKPKGKKPAPKKTVKGKSKSDDEDEDDLDDEEDEDSDDDFDDEEDEEEEKPKKGKGKPAAKKAPVKKTPAKKTVKGKKSKSDDEDEEEEEEEEEDDFDDEEDEDEDD